MECRMSPVGQLISYSIGGGWGKEAPQESYQVRVAVIRGADFPSIEKGDFKSLPIRWEKEAKANKAALQAGDIVLEISGGTDNRPTGRTLLITKELLNHYNCPVIPASFCRLIRPTAEIDSAYLFYWLQDMYKRGRTWGYQNRSTGLANFQYKVFTESELVAVPKYVIQQQIAKLLLSLDAKQHVNNRLNDYLAV